MCDALVIPAGFYQRIAKIVLSHEIAMCHRQGVRPQAEIIVPVGQLPVRDHAKRNHDHDASGECIFFDREPIPKFSDSPNNNYEQTNERQISVAVSHGLIAYLNQADHRNHCAQIPEPSPKQIAMFSISQH